MELSPVGSACKARILFIASFSMSPYLKYGYC
jgi:hypothetical protein